MWLLVAIGCMPLQFEVEGNTTVMTGIYGQCETEIGKSI